MHLTPDILRACYDFLRVTPPFRGWRLPLGEEVGFRVSRHRDILGLCESKTRDGPYRITVSDVWVGHTTTLLQVMAHEMIHVHEAQAGRPFRSKHDSYFKRCWAQVAKHHGFDPKTMSG